MLLCWFTQKAQIQYLGPIAGVRRVNGALCYPGAAYLPIWGYPKWLVYSGKNHENMDDLRTTQSRAVPSRHGATHQGLVAVSIFAASCNTWVTVEEHWRTHVCCGQYLPTSSLNQKWRWSSIRPVALNHLKSHFAGWHETWPLGPQVIFDKISFWSPILPADIPTWSHLAVSLLKNPDQNLNRWDLEQNFLHLERAISGPPSWLPGMWIDKS